MTDPTGINYKSSEWWAIKRYLEGRISDLQREIENRMEEIATTEIRATIRFARELLALDVPEPETQKTNEEEEIF